ncbi:uncharacterized protein zgc:174888 [Oncorhynchus nerka]|uniref:uncharacterized protein zgc:174888 n=1 Tax=Oncorhynchus nerka TaxID=8023 RepID=UPI0031B82141
MKIKRMSRSVLLLLSILTVQGSGCDDFLREVVKNLQTTLNSDHAGFRKVFPKDYWISHHYNVNLLCNTDPCCVFRAATVLSDSWLQLRGQLWPEHHSFQFISNLIQALDGRGMTKGCISQVNSPENWLSINDSACTVCLFNNNSSPPLSPFPLLPYHIPLSQRFEDPDPSVLPSVSSSPEKLLNFTSSVFSKWLELGCSTPVDTCPFPTLASPAGEEERAALERKKVRSLTTRAVHMQHRENEGETEMRLNTPPPTNRSPTSKGGLLLVLSGSLFFLIFI